MTSLGKRWKLSENTKKKMSIRKIGNKNAYKEDKTKYDTIHARIKKKFGIPIRCIFCGISNLKMKDGKNGINWANINHKYNLHKKDWIQLCYFCHKKHDKKLRDAIKETKEKKKTKTRVNRI